MAIFGTVGTILGIVVASITIWQFCSDPGKVDENIVIAVDSSKVMNESVEDGRTRMELAKEALKDRLVTVPDQANLALRLFGGECDSNDNARLKVDFSQQNEDRIARAIDAIEPTGDTRVVHGIVQATGDFADMKRFEGTEKKIIALLGGCDSCVRDFVSKLNARMGEKQDIQVRHHLIGIDLEEDCREQYADLQGVTTFFPTDSRQLTEAVDKAFSNGDFPDPAPAPSTDAPLDGDLESPQPSPGDVVPVEPGPTTYEDLALFEFDKFDLTERSKLNLDRFMDESSETDNIRSIELIGHTCDMGSERHNIRLGMRRAKAVEDYLSLGMDPNILSVYSMGSSRPIAENTSIEKRVKNRRVEILVRYRAK